MESGPIRIVDHVQVQSNWIASIHKDTIYAFLPLFKD